MEGLVLVIFYGSILFCIFACIYKIVYYARFPMHLRWEVYRRSSVYESAGWWRKKGITGGQKIGGAARDILSLRDYFNNNRLFWLALYPFHLGVYSLITWHVWLFVYPPVTQKDWLVEYSLLWGHISTGLMFTGALGVLVMRFVIKSLRTTYPRRHYFKWLMIMAAAGTGFIAVEYYFNGAMADVLDYVRVQLQFNMAEKMNPPLMPSLHALTVSAVLVYLPFSHALRLFLRYYHEWRWDYLPVLRSARAAKNTKNMLEYPVTWAAEHAAAGIFWKDLT